MYRSVAHQRSRILKHIQERDIHVLVFSAGLADIIEAVLIQELHKSSKNVKVVSNRMVFDNDGYPISLKGVFESLSIVAHPRSFGFSGTKDKRAVSSQREILATIKGLADSLERNGFISYFT
ncbi:uncharacterized protein LOC126665125 [Mercurialis annua]|uniref:uncharacterized protein LOC126665125 n=1 Tax=Mercurialis annua TaxID=3986 RepID=UPI00215EA28E|nr:uncharacterized protein LOC126665125 [Mercurialis annua]